MKISEIISINITSATTQHYCQASWRKLRTKPEDITQAEWGAFTEEEATYLVHCQNLAQVKMPDGGYLCGECASMFPGPYSCTIKFETELK